MSMDYSKLRIPLEEQIGTELYNLVQGNLLESILKEAKIEKIENEWKYILEGHSFKVSKSLAPKIFYIFQEVKEKLAFNEETEIYVTNSPDLNAFALTRLEENEPNIININSRLIEMLNDEELKFILGHEFGHLISQNAKITKLIHFVFPGESRMPFILVHKINLWSKLAELTADRFGYLANPNLETIASCFFKLSSGLDTKRINFDFNAYLDENERIIEYFNNNKAQNILSHPINPIRIKAIELFEKSDLFRSVMSPGVNKEDTALEASMQKLIDILMTLSSSEMDQHRRNFIASAGLIAAGVDRNPDQDEIETIISTLSTKTIFPQEYLHEIYSSKQISQIFTGSINAILSQNPGERYPMFEYMINLCLVDRKILAEEIQFLYDIGEKMFGFTKKEIAQMMAESIQKSFIPDVYS